MEETFSYSAMIPVMFYGVLALWFVGFSLLSCASVAVTILQLQ